MEATTYILQFNEEILYASRNIKTLWQVMVNRCLNEGRKAPEPYATVRRRLVAEAKYIHEPLPGWTYKIVSRQLLKKTVQLRIPLNEFQASLQKSDLTKLG